jgi:small subunit ribosomal protein S9
VARKKKKDEEQPEAEAPAAEETAAPEEPAAEEPAAEEPAAAEPVVEEPAPEEPVAEEPAAEEPAVEEPAAEEPAAEAPAAEEPVAEEPVAEEPVAEEPASEEPAAEEPAAAEPAAAEPAADAAAPDETVAQEPAPAGDAAAPRPKPEIPGADLEVDIVPEGVDALTPAEAAAAEAEAEAEPDAPVSEVEPEPAPMPTATIDLGKDARYTATGKRKTAVARVILRPGKGAYTVNGKPLNDFFPRPTLQRNIRQPLEQVGYEERMDVVAAIHGGGVSAQAGALRHGISKALIDADPNLRSELKRRGFLTRDARVKERKKAGLKKARKRPQFSKR